MQVMSDGIQQAAGERMQRALNFMTRNRFVAVITGLVVTALIQSSSAVTVMLVTFVNAGLLTLPQSIGVILGSNIGTTITAWIVSLIGFKIDIAALALPAVAAGFVLRSIKWKHKQVGEALLGFGLLFMGLDVMTSGLPQVSAEQVTFIADLSHLGFLSLLIGVGVGTVLTLVMHSSAATITLVITLAHGGVIEFDMAAAMIMGANIGTTIDATMASLGVKAAARRTALVHILFNVFGTVICLIFFRPFVALVNFIIPGSPGSAGIATHLAAFHSVFNISACLIILPFVKQFAALVSFLVKDKSEDLPTDAVYRFSYQSGTLQNSAELNLLRAEKEIRDMAGLTAGMFTRFSGALSAGEGAAAALVEELREKEDYADQMREELTRFLMECAALNLNPQTARSLTRLIRIIADLEDMTDICFSLSLILEKGLTKEHHINDAEIEALRPYVRLVQDFLGYVQVRLGAPLSGDPVYLVAEVDVAVQMKADIEGLQNKLSKLSRRRIKAGENIKTEFLFMDLVREIVSLGAYCGNIFENLPHPPAGFNGRSLHR
jgi:phosphate:Na+ symporter